MGFRYIFKYIIVGESSVGKSCLLLQFTDSRFKEAHDLTIGVDFGSKTIAINEDTNVKVQIWDTAGQESFRSITRSYYRGSICALLVYDITRRSTFDNLTRWLDDMRDSAYTKMMIVLIGNKDDLKVEREITTEEAQEFADKHNLLFFETSAKTGHNIQPVFVHSATQIIDNIVKGHYDLRTENIGIKPGNTFKATVDQTTHQIKPNNLLRDPQQQQQNNEGGCCS